MFKKWRVTSVEAGSIAGLVVASALVFGLIDWQMIFNLGADYAMHIEFARDILQHGYFIDTHVMFQFLIIGLTLVFPISFELASWIVILVFQLSTLLIIYALIRRAVGGDHWRSWGTASVTALALLLVTPITLITLYKHNLYYGYIGINVFHNPTIFLLKPFALVLFVFTIVLLKSTARLNVRTLIVGITLVLLSMFAKPNYVLVLLPALLVVVAYRFYRGHRQGMSAVIGALIVPMTVLLAAVYFLQYHLIENTGGGIVFAPLSIYMFDQALTLLPIKFILSTLFPLIVTLLYHRKAFKDLRLRLAWLVFFAGAAQMFLLAESGRLSDGNFWWSAQIGLFVLFVVAALFWLQHFRDRPGWRGRVCLIVFVVHLIFGILFYGVQFSAPNMAAWW
ncbi:MAG: hypothetical protein ABI700_06185 [Chloroflexota bacterium]